MKRFSLLVGLMLLVCGGCASVPRTTTYQATEWKEIEVASPSVTRIIQADIPTTFPGAKKGRKYLNIGYKPVNPNRALAPGEVEFILPVDVYVETIDRDGKHVRGWLLAGERVICVPTANPDFYKAIWIRRCGNDLFNEEKIAIFIRVRRETVAQSPTKRWEQVRVAHTRELTCRERKAEVSWWRKGLSYAVTGVVGTGGALIGGAVSNSPHGIQVGAGVGVFLGRLVGGYTDGSECVDASDVTEGVMLGVAAGMIAPTKAPKAPAHVSGPGTPPPNGPGGPAPLPPNGPAPITSIGGPAPLPSNGPAYFNGGAPIAPAGPSFLPFN